MSSTVLDVFNNSAFSLVEMTKAINVIPSQYGLLNEMGVFKEKGVQTTSISVEKKNGVLNILSASERGGSGTLNKSGKRELISFDIPHFDHYDSVKAADIQGIRKFDSSSELENVQDVVLDRLREMKAKHEITLEYMRCGALQGKVMDGDGTIIANLFDKFDITQKTQNFAFGTTTTDVPSLLRTVKRKVEKDLNGEVMNKLICLCSGTWFDSFVSHETVKEAYRMYQGASPLREDQRASFVFQGIEFIEYEGSASNAAGETLRFIPDSEAVFFPAGTMNVFETVFAPADYVETVNTIGMPYYAKQDVQRFEKGVDIETQSNPLPICKRPDLLVKATKS